MTSPSQHRPEGDRRDDKENRQGPVAGHSEEFLTRAESLLPERILYGVDRNELAGLRDGIAAALREVARKAREECAGIADGFKGSAAAYITERIRASIRS